MDFYWTGDIPENSCETKKLAALKGGNFGEPCMFSNFSKGTDRPDQFPIPSFPPATSQEADNFSWGTQYFS